MPIETVGFTGTVDEVEFARLMALAGVRYSVAGASDFRVTAVAGDRRVAVAPGSAYAAGVRAESDESILVDLGTPSVARWDLLVLRRDWLGRTAEVAVVPGATTAATVPTSAPAMYPTLFTEPGIRDDQPLAWAWVRASTTAVLLFDVRTTPSNGEPAVPTGALLRYLSGTGIAGDDPDASPLLLNAGTAVVNINSNGDGTITFGKPFPNGLLTVELGNGDDVARIGVYFSRTSATRAGVNFRAYNYNGRLGAGNTRVDYLAIGW